MNLVSTTIFTSANHHLTIPNNKIWKDIIHNITSEPEIRLDLFYNAPINAESEVKYVARFWICSDDIDEAKWVTSEGVKKQFDEKGISNDILENLKARAI